LANVVRERLHGNKAYYNRNRHINYTNVCALSCKFCSFYRKRGEEGAYEMPVEQVVATARKRRRRRRDEVHIVGGLHPWLKFDYYLDMLRGIRAACPSCTSRPSPRSRSSTSAASRDERREVFDSLRDAGLGSLPGGGAEIFDDRVHDEIFKGKVRADKWFDVHRTAHRLGIYSNATMLYGHVETPAERVGHLVKLRELQAESLANSPRAFQLHDPPVVHPRAKRIGPPAGPDGPDRPQDACDRPADAEQRGPREGVLDHAGDRPVAGGPGLGV
jgi:aminodeoxyfutalosine synthase